MKFHGSKFMFFASIFIEVGLIGLISLLIIKGEPRLDSSILQISAFLFVIGVLPMVYVLLYASVSIIIDEDGVCKSLFSRRFGKMFWAEIVEIGVQYPYGIENYMTQVYFSKKIIRNDSPNKLFYEKDKKCFIALPYTKELENHILNLAEINPSIRDKFREFPRAKSETK